jgi:hypothetical protein
MSDACAEAVSLAIPIEGERSMSFVPGYKNDVFISYAHIDNDPFISGKQGWVDNFEEMLHKLVRGKSGEEVVFFRDPKLRRYGEFADQLMEELSQSAAFLCILSPRYLKSESCRRELQEFRRLAGNHRIINIVKTELDEQEVPPEINRILDYRFYRKNESTGRSSDLHPEIDPDHFPEYFRLMESIAQTLVDLWKGLRKVKIS